MALSPDLRNTEASGGKTSISESTLGGKNPTNLISSILRLISRRFQVHSQVSAAVES